MRTLEAQYISNIVNGELLFELEEVRFEIRIESKFNHSLPFLVFNFTHKTDFGETSFIQRNPHISFDELVGDDIQSVVDIFGHPTSGIHKITYPNLVGLEVAIIFVHLDDHSKEQTHLKHTHGVVGIDQFVIFDDQGLGAL